MSLGTVVDFAVVNVAKRLAEFRRELEKTGLFTGGRLMTSPREQIDEIVADLIRFRAKEKARKEKENRIKNVKAGDTIVVLGYSVSSGLDFKATYRENKSLIVTGHVSGFPDTLECVECGAGAHRREYVMKSSIVDVSPALVEKVRGEDRRVERQDAVMSGSELHLVKTLEAMNRSRGLSEDEKEVLKAAQARIRKDRTANGYRKGGDRRINGQF